MKRIRKRYVVGLFVVTTAAIGYFTCATWLPAVGRWLDVGEPPVRADYAFVAAGDPDTRAFTAGLLHKHGYVRKILLTRPPRNPGSARAFKELDELAQAILVHQGVKPEDIRVVEGDVYSTMDEARLIAPLIRAEPQATFVVVTSNYHTRRTLWAFCDAVPEAAGRLHAFAAPTEGFGPDNWWRTEAGPATYLMEYLRLTFYHVRYGAAGYAFVAIALALIVVKIGRRYLRDFLARRGGGLGRNSARSAT